MTSGEHYAEYIYMCFHQSNKMFLILMPVDEIDS
jgi:hypothetical protein